jgi:hypothetical protein
MFGVPSKDELKLIFKAFEEELGRIAVDPSTNLAQRVQNLESFVINLGKLLT